MTASIDNPNKTNGKTMAGIIILVIGSILLIDQLNIFFIPSWLFSWPIWMIAYGVYMGGKYNFKKPIWIYIIILACAFLITENVDHAGRFIWPVAIIGAGTWMVLKHNNKPTNTPKQQHRNYTEI
jgi:hypothetical protein